AGDGNHTLLAAVLVAIAVLGYLASRGVPLTKAVAPDLAIRFAPWSETWRIVGYARRERSVFLSILGISWFWFYGSAITLQVPAYTRGVLNGGEEITTLLLVVFSVGVAG